MTLPEFEASPWKVLHRGYADSFLNMRPAPEYASGEVIVSSLYRATGFAGFSEGSVPALGKEFTRRVQQGAGDSQGRVLDDETWRLVLEETLVSPKLPSQSQRRFVLLCPIVPDVAAYSGSARLTRNSWNPGALVQRMVRFGMDSDAEASRLWAALFEALTVGPEDDPWARMIEDEFTRWRSPLVAWQMRKLEDFPPLEAWRCSGRTIPARQFVADLQKVLQLKPRLTRRQWIGVLESLLRISSVAHVMWLCRANARTYDLLRLALNGQPPDSVEEATERLLGGDAMTWHLGQPIVPAVRTLAREFLVARAGINLLLFLAEEAGLAQGKVVLSSIDSIHSLAVQLSKRRKEIEALEPWVKLQEIIEKDSRVLACKRGIGKNIEEFARHALGRRQSAEEQLLGYDQGYFAKKEGQHKSARWVVSPGPIAVMTLCHCCSAGHLAARTVEHFCQHLSNYGIGVKPNDLAGSELGATLRNLGLVLDSPDAEGGMVVLDPFRVRSVNA
jgi:hypothetical protein